MTKKKASKQPGSAKAASSNSSGSPSSTGTGAATAGSREDAADAAMEADSGGAGDAVTDIVFHSAINWNVGNPDGDDNTATDDNN